jgi:hypothetical protein
MQPASASMQKNVRVTCGDMPTLKSSRQHINLTYRHQEEPRHMTQLNWLRSGGSNTQ